MINIGHTWRRPEVLPADCFAAWATDVRAVIADLPGEMIRAEDGEGDPVITTDLVAFNGNRRYRVSAEEDPTAVYRDPDQLAAHRTEDNHDNDARSPFSIARVFFQRQGDAQEEDGLLLDSVAPDDLPHDLAITAALILFASHFAGIVQVSSDYSTDHWLPGLALAERATGRKFSIPHQGHGWIRPPRLSAAGFAAWRDDVARVIATTDYPIAGPDGVGAPILTDMYVAFNGPTEDGYKPLCITRDYDPACGEINIGVGYWFMNTLGTTSDGRTRYDEVVTAVLILLKHHFPDEPAVDIQSDNPVGAVEIFSRTGDGGWLSGLALAERSTGLRLVIPARWG